MPFIELKEDQLINVKSLDEQHEEIARSISRLYQLIQNGSIEEQIEEMGKLNDLINKHFDFEDRIMVENKDPGFISHKLEHNRMRMKTARVYDTVRLNKEPLNEEYINGLKSWLENHLIFKDIKLGKYLNSIGIK